MNTKEITKWFKTAMPNPTIEGACLQIGRHYEEVAEMAEALSDSSLRIEIDDVAVWYKNKEPDYLISMELLLDGEKIELLNSLCDQIVTAIGVAYMLGMDIGGALDEVNKSNHSKFDNGKAVFDENGKIRKGKYYFKPDLSAFIGSAK